MQAFRLPRDVVRASGPEAVSYLHGQLSQDIASLAVGDSTRSFLLEPTGKTVAWLRLTRIADDELILDTDAGIGEAMVARLQRFKLRMKCEFDTLDWELVALRGADVPEAAALNGSADVVVDAGWPGGDSGVDLLGANVAVPDGAAEGSVDDYEALRVAAGVPVTGVDLVIDGIPNEGGPWVVGSSVSFTKGCYTGQELVMRIDSRGGNVPHPLRALELAGNTAVVGAELMDADGKDVGRITSVGRGKALALVGRAVEPGSTVTARWPNGETTAVVTELPPR